MKIKMTDLLWLCLAYILFYCLSPALFPSFMVNVNLAAVIFLIFIFVLTKGIKRCDSIWIIFFLIYAAYIIVQTLASELVDSTISVYKLYLACPALMILGILICNSFSYDVSKRQCQIWKFMWAWGFVMFAVGVYEVFSGNYVMSTSEEVLSIMESFSSGSGGIIRAMVFSKGYLLVGDLFGVLTITAYCLYNKYRQRRYLVSIFIFFAGTFLGSSRGSLVGTIAGLLAIYLFGKKRKWASISIKKLMGIFKWLVIFIILFIVIMILAQSVEAIAYWTNRLTSIFDWSGDHSNSLRLEHWLYYLDIWVSTPLNFFIGTGGKTAGDLTTKYSVTESGFIEHLVEIGLIGSFFYYVLMLFPFVEYIRSKYRTEFGDWTMGCFAIIFVHDFVLQVSQTDYMSLLMWLLVALMIVENRRIKTLGDKIVIYDLNNTNPMGDVSRVDDHRYGNGILS